MINFNSEKNAMGYNSGTECLMGILPFFHIYGLMNIMNGGLSRGARIVTLPSFQPVSYLETIQKYRVSYHYSLARPTAHWPIPLLPGSSHCSLVHPTAHWLIPLLPGSSHCSLAHPTAHWLIPLLPGSSYYSLAHPTTHWLIPLLTSISHCSLAYPTAHWHIPLLTGLSLGLKSRGTVQEMLYWVQCSL